MDGLRIIVSVGMALLGPPFLLAGAAEKPAEDPSKAAWIIHMQTHLPSELCKETLYFRRCFEVTSEECLSTTETLLQACLNNTVVGLPATLTPEEGAKWGLLVSRCTHDLYEKWMSSKKRSTQDCHP